MAREIIENRTDDIDGTPAVDTIRFAISGVDYEIDLSAENAQRFWDAIGPFMKAARRVVRRRRERPYRAGIGVWTDPAKVRAYARWRGIPVNSRGYPRSDIQRMYIQAWLDGEMPKQFM